MTERQIRIPGPDHPISITPTRERVRVLVGNQAIVDTREGLLLEEKGHSPVYYVPRRDVRMELLERSPHQTYCPYKGDASYFSIPLGGSKSQNAVWTYETPFEAVSSIKGHLAFYPDRVDSLDVA